MTNRTRIFIAAFFSFSVLTSATTTPTAWIGTYEFSEVGGRIGADVAPPGIAPVIEYSVNVFPGKSGLLADIDIDGYQSMKRLRCNAKQSGNELVLLFREYREGNVGGRLKVGDTLLKLIRTEKKLLTEWGEIEPQFSGDNYPKRAVYFEKQDRRTNR